MNLFFKIFNLFLYASIYSYPLHNPLNDLINPFFKKKGKKKERKSENERGAPTLRLAASPSQEDQRPSDAAFSGVPSATWSSHLRLRRSPSLPESQFCSPPARGVVGSFFRMRAWCAWSLVVGFRLKSSVVSISFYHFPHARIEVNRV